jgi:ATP synthase F1 delta subunit
MSPDGPIDEMKDALRDVMRRAADRVDLEGLRDSLESMVNAGEDEGGETAVVTSAVKLTKDERQTIENRLREGHGEELPIRFKVDPNILGGVVVRVGDRYIDGSVSARLGRLREELTGSRGR